MFFGDVGGVSITIAFGDVFFITNCLVLFISFTINFINKFALIFSVNFKEVDKHAKNSFN